MGKLSIDLAKVKRPSLRGVQIPPKEKPQERPITGPWTASNEEEVYSRLIDKNPLVEALVSSFDLVSCKTGEPIKRITTEGEYRLPQDEGENRKLRALALEMLEGENGYLREEVIAMIQERAETGFNMMLRAGAVMEDISQGLYYLPGSTPF